MHWKRITLVGVGLLGGSLGLALKKRRLADAVIGYVRRPASIADCERAGAVDHATTDLAEAAAGSELLVLCTPLSQMRSLAEQFAGALKRGAIVTDVGSVKASVVRELEPLILKAGGRFVGSHPMAGAEKTGVLAARENLFTNAVCVVTPSRSTNRPALRQVEQLWKKVGGCVLQLTPEVHDQLVSRSSHLPHVIAAELANFVLDPAHPKPQPALCANGFRDTTRIASGSPEMWRDIALANRENLQAALDAFINQVQSFKRLLKNRDQDAIRRFFEQAKHRRDSWSSKSSSASPE